MKCKKKITGHLITIFLLSFFLLSAVGCKQQTTETNALANDDITSVELEDSDIPVYLNCKPDDRSKHVYLDQKGIGACNTLTGDILVTIIFVNGNESVWNEQDIEETKQICEMGMDTLMQSAREYGIDLTIQLNYSTSFSGRSVDSESFYRNVDPILGSVLLPESKTLPEYLEKEYSVKEAPIVFVANCAGRSHASSLDELEYVLWYRNPIEEADSCATTLQHELLHLFGAKDFYFPEQVKKLAEECMPDSIMNEGSIVDELTAYLVGWKDEFSDTTNHFVQETAMITQAQITEESKKDQRDGYGTTSWMNGFYSGQLKDGIPQGHGKLTWEDGSYYEGDWIYGLMHGFGTMVSSTDSNVGNWIVEISYTGEWVDGCRHGKGTSTYSDGYVVEGIWEYDQQIQ